LWRICGVRREKRLCMDGVLDWGERPRSGHMAKKKCAKASASMHCIESPAVAEQNPMFGRFLFPCWVTSRWGSPCWIIFSRSR
jgi:hypothetical protein